MGAGLQLKYSSIDHCHLQRELPSGSDFYSKSAQLSNHSNDLKLSAPGMVDFSATFMISY